MIIELNFSAKTLPFLLIFMAKMIVSFSVFLISFFTYTIKRINMRRNLSYQRIFNLIIILSTLHVFDSLFLTKYVYFVSSLIHVGLFRFVADNFQASCLDFGHMAGLLIWSILFFPQTFVKFPYFMRIRQFHWLSPISTLILRILFSFSFEASLLSALANMYFLVEIYKGSSGWS